MIEKWHPDTEDITYTMSVEAKGVYSKIANQIVELRNKKWEDPPDYYSIGNLSKDVRTVLRFVPSVLWSA